MHTRSWVRFALFALLTALLTACTNAQHRTSTPLAGHAQITGAAKNNFTPEQRQQVLASAQARLIAQCDSVISRIGQSADAITQGNKDSIVCGTAVALKVNVATSVINIASQSEPDVGLLNMTVVLTLESAVFHAKQPEGRTYAETIFGPNSKLLLDTLDDLQNKSWKIDADFYAAAQLDSLRTYLNGWLTRHPDAREVADVRIDALVDTQAQSSSGHGGQSGGFVMLVDIDEATREADEIRRLGERALFISQRFPTLMRWQAELLSLDLANQPTPQRALGVVDQANANIIKITPDVQLFLTSVPATLDKLQTQLQTFQTNLPETLKETQPLLDKVQLTTADIRASLVSIDEISKRYAPAPGAATQPAGEPFSIANYTKAAAQLADTAHALRELVDSSDKLVETEAWKARIADINGLTKDRIKEIDAITEARTDGVFTRGVEAIIIFFVCLLVYRIVAATLLRSKPGK